MLSKNSADRHFDSPSGSRIDLRCGAVIEAKHPAESTAIDVTVGGLELP